MIGLNLFYSEAQACATCGLNESFSPKMLFISLGFVVLPMCFVAFVAWWQIKGNNKKN